ncbi:MAG TPA: NAD(P)-dependent oxidoreductase [Candidatus Saccharimonadales bacterium]|nr:NAD(P)-dependent oxidoreductase [Candidatus Saccharimonadales bacterium]
MNSSEIIIIGANGQLGKALQAKYPGAQAVDIDTLNIGDADAVEQYDWAGTKLILNAAAYTNVDGAESDEGRVSAWQANAAAVRNLVKTALMFKLTLVHVSTDYVFDGTHSPHLENEDFSPLSVYGASKAAGDILVSLLPNHYILRTSWVIGEGKNFVRTMLELAKKGINPVVVSDQIGRLTFTSELVRAVDHLLDSHAPAGTYNVSNNGTPVSWADIAREIFKAAKLNNSVSNVTTIDYYKGKTGIAPRPLNSTLDLSKIKATGFVPNDWQVDLQAYIEKEMSS